MCPCVHVSMCSNAAATALWCAGLTRDLAEERGTEIENGSGAGGIPPNVSTFEVVIRPGAAAGVQMAGTAPDGQVIMFAVPPNVAGVGGTVNVPY